MITTQSKLMAAEAKVTEMQFMIDHLKIDKDAFEKYNEELQERLTQAENYAKSVSEKLIEAELELKKPWYKRIF
jgi:hypothetical protein